jgi:hypothetical protein
MKELDISKIFGSNCRTKLLEKFFLEYESGNNDGFYMRWLSRDLEEQINSVKRELDSLESLWLLKSKMELRKKIFFINKNFSLIEEFMSIFIKTYNPINNIKKFFKKKSDLELVIVNESIKTKLISDWKNILDIFLIWDIDKEELSEFLANMFYGRKVKFASLTTEDFFKRLEFWDKLIKNILNEKWNIFLIDKLKIKEKLEN